jgi:hypothetical protein
VRNLSPKWVNNIFLVAGTVVVGTGGRVAGPLLVPDRYSSFVELETVVLWRRELWEKLEPLKERDCARMVGSIQRQIAEEVGQRWRNLEEWLS